MILTYGISTLSLLTPNYTVKSWFVGTTFRGLIVMDIVMDT